MNPSVILLLGLLVLLYMNFVGRRRALRARAAMQERLLPGAQVVTTSGLHAAVTEVGDDGTVLLESAPGLVTRWDALAVGRVLSSPADAATAVPTEEPTVEPSIEPSVDTAPPDRP